MSRRDGLVQAFALVMAISLVGDTAAGVVQLPAHIGPSLDAGRLPPGHETARPLPAASTFQTPSPDEAGAVQPGPRWADVVTGQDARPPVSLPARIELYAGAVSITPGQQLELHVSTPARFYRYRVERFQSTLPSGTEVVATAERQAGHDYRSLATFNGVQRTARANWPVTDRVETAGWAPGIYVVYAEDSDGTLGHAITVVRTPVLSADAPAFVFTALTYQAYNLWGGANLYSYAAPPAQRVSFDRPYGEARGRGFWTRYDDRILAWLQRQGLRLQFTTDYDLASSPPDVGPRLLILPQHAEYVPRSLRDWLHRRVNQHGDMNLLSFGANGFYWQVRLAAPPRNGAPFEIVCYKDPDADPAAASAPELVTTRWRDAPVNQPEGRLLGAQYVGILGDGYTRHDLRVTAAMPSQLLRGTGWQAGTLVRGLLLGEGDAVDPASGGLAVMEGSARDRAGRRVQPTVTIRTSPARARAFLAGTFAWVDGLSPVKADMGVPAASFDRFNRNVLDWLAVPGGF